MKAIIKHSSAKKEYFIEINNLDDVLNLIKKHKESIIIHYEIPDDPEDGDADIEIEIYDAWRE